MKQLTPLEQVFSSIRSRGLNTWLDRLTFYFIFVIWISVIIIFGVAYYSMPGSTSFLYSNVNREVVSSIQDAIYFSFITATSTGFGDIIPFGLFKIIAICEVVFGLLLLALVTSKIVSVKQDMIISEIYEISLNEKVNRLRSALFLFRQTLSRIINNIDEGVMRKRELGEVYVYFSSLEDTLNEIRLFITRKQRKRCAEGINSLSVELLLTSITSSLEKLNELIAAMNEAGLEWRKDSTLELIKRSLDVAEGIFASVDSSGELGSAVSDLRARKTRAVSSIKAGLKQPGEPAAER